jgi:hypothetical protein
MSGSEMFWAHPMELLHDMGHAQSHFDLMGDIVCVGVRKVHDLCQTYHMLKNHFGRT